MHGSEIANGRAGQDTCEALDYAVVILRRQKSDLANQAAETLEALKASLEGQSASVEPGFGGVLLITAQQAAALCQVSVDRIYEWSCGPNFPVIAGKHQLRIHGQMFDDWLRRRAATGRSAVEQPHT
jgi:hypothetical protein